METATGRRIKAGRNSGKLERQLGFRQQRIFGRRPKGPIYKRLFEEVDPIIEKASDLEEPDSWTPSSALPSINRAFDVLGPLIWPSQTNLIFSEEAWLVDALTDSWEGLYPRNLSYEVEEDRNILRKLFSQWITEKCVVRRSNIKNGLVRSRGGSGVYRPQTSQKKKSTSVVDLGSFDDSDDEPWLENAFTASGVLAKSDSPYSGTTGKGAHASVVTLRFGDSPASSGAHLGTRQNISYQPAFNTKDDITGSKRKRRESSDSDDRTSLTASCSIKHRSFSLVVVLRLPPSKLRAMEAKARVPPGSSMSASASSSGSTRRATTRDSITTATTQSPGPGRVPMSRADSRHASWSPVPDTEVDTADQASFEGQAQSPPRTKRNYVKSGKYAKKKEAGAPESEMHLPNAVQQEQMRALYNDVFAPPSASRAAREQPSEAGQTDQPTVQEDVSNTATSAAARIADVGETIRTESSPAPEAHALRHEDAAATLQTDEVEAPPDIDETAAGANRSPSRQEIVPWFANTPVIKVQSEEPEPEPEPRAYSAPPEEPEDILDRATLSISWNPPQEWNVDLDVPDWATMADCASPEDFFVLVEAQMPRELMEHGGRIVQVKVKLTDGVDGPKLDCRMLRDDRGRGALRQMLKKLRAQCETCEPELRVEVVEWA